MALAIIQQPVQTAGGTDQVPVLTNYTPSVGYMIYQDQSIASLFYYKIVLEIRETDATGTLLGIIKQRRNGYATDVTNDKARAFFDLKELINSQLIPTTYDQNQTTAPFVTIHKVGFNGDQKSFSYSGDALLGKSQLLPVYVKAYENYSSSANAMPSDDTSEAVDNTLWWLKASMPVTTAREPIAGSTPEYIQGSVFSAYRGSWYTNKFLSDVKSIKVNSYRDVDMGSASKHINFIRENDWHTVAFLNNHASFWSNIKHIEVAYYDEDDNNLSVTYFDNEPSKGGVLPTGTITKFNALLYFGCGTANLENQGFSANARPSHAGNSGWKYYTIRGSSGDDDTENPIGGHDGYPLDPEFYETTRYYFVKDTSGGCKYPIRRLAWFNSKGGYDYFNFMMKSTQTLDITRDNYETLVGNFGGDYYSYNNTSRGKVTRKTGAILRETLETDWILEKEGEFLESLFTSIRVDIVENDDTDYTESVIIKNTSFTRKTIVNDKFIQYQVEIEYAIPRNTNS